MLRRVLYVVLGPRSYLRLVSRVFLVAFRSGWLRTRPAYAAHYAARALVRKGDTIVDIGANLGYFTVPLADATGPSGRVLAVEPVGLYREVLAINVAGRPQVEVVPFALGATDGREVELGIPGGHTAVRHGLAHVLAPGERDSQAAVFPARMRHPVAVLADLTALDYVKCDVEGYEGHILPAMAPLIARFLPVVQVESFGASREALVVMFAGLGYGVFGAGPDHLVRLAPGEVREHAWDLFFVHPRRSKLLSTRW